MLRVHAGKGFEKGIGSLGRTQVAHMHERGWTLLRLTLLRVHVLDCVRQDLDAREASGTCISFPKASQNHGSETAPVGQPIQPFVQNGAGRQRFRSASGLKMHEHTPGQHAGEWQKHHVSQTRYESWSSRGEEHPANGTARTDANQPPHHLE